MTLIELLGSSTKPRGSLGRLLTIHWREAALARLLEAVAASGDYDRAEALIRQLTDPEPWCGSSTTGS